MLEKLAADFEHFRHGLPDKLEDYVLESYGISLASRYGKHAIRNPVGKASGQLSLNAAQVRRDHEAGLGFVVLKTVIAEDETGSQSMSAWATTDTHMTAHEIAGTRRDVIGEPGWTVSWKGRGWGGTFSSYLDLLSGSLAISDDLLVVPSCKYHLPQHVDEPWLTSEYDYATGRLLETWRKHRDDAMALEKDFSPTLAGDRSFTEEKANILRWLQTVPRLIREAAKPDDISLGIKVFNARFEDDFQLEMLDTLSNGAAAPDVLIYGNRLFDPNREYEGKRGIAYGGPDLSSRNLEILSAYSTRDRKLPISATGNITSGRVMYEYLKRGAASFQMHTLFQLPDTCFYMTSGTRTARALHLLLFHPQDGFLRHLLQDKMRYEWRDGIRIDEIAAALPVLSRDNYRDN